MSLRPPIHPALLLLRLPGLLRVQRSVRGSQRPHRIQTSPILPESPLQSPGSGVLLRRPFVRSCQDRTLPTGALLPLRGRRVSTVPARWLPARRRPPHQVSRLMFPEEMFLPVRLPGCPPPHLHPRSPRSLFPRSESRQPAGPFRLLLHPDRRWTFPPFRESARHRNMITV